MGAPSRILVTGFGPFPGVPENISAWLALRLASGYVRPAFNGRVEAHVLPTEWAEVARLAPALLNSVRPRLVLHLGVSRRARGIRLERRAENIADARIDARGALPPSATVFEGKPAILRTPLPATRLAARLRDHGLSAAASRSCGAYLCNFLYYRSLDWAHRQPSPCDVLFVHVPAGAGNGVTPAGAELLRGASLLLDWLLAHIEQGDSGEQSRRDRAIMPAAAAS